MKENAFVLAQRFIHQFVEPMVKRIIINAWLNVPKRFVINIEPSD
jgi:hypothetical protein